MENAYFKIGGVISPLSTTDGYSLLQSADPVLYYMLDYIEGVLNLHALDRWNLEIQKFGLTDLEDKLINHKIPYDPLPYMQTAQFRFPLLSIYRVSEIYEERTKFFDHIISKLELLYILPPLAAEQMEGISPILKHIARIIYNRTEQSFDENYNSGQKVWQISELEEIRCVNGTYGNIPGAGNLFFPALHITFELKERTNPYTSYFENYDGIDGYVSIHTDGYPDYLIASVAT